MAGLSPGIRGGRPWPSWAVCACTAPGRSRELSRITDTIGCPRAYPAACPPMPSHTTKMPWRESYPKLSSLLGRTQPTSVLPATSTAIVIYSPASESLFLVLNPNEPQRTRRNTKPVRLSARPSCAFVYSVVSSPYYRVLARFGGGIRYCRRRFVPGRRDEPILATIVCRLQPEC